MTFPSLPAARTLTGKPYWLRLVVALVAVQGLVGLASAHGMAPVLLALIGGAAGVALLWRRPLVPALALVVLTSTIFTAAYVPMIMLAKGRGIWLTEVIVAGYIAVRGLRLAVTQDRSYRLGLLDFILGLFLLHVLLSVYLAVSNGRIDLGTAQLFGRKYLLYASLWVFAGSIRDERTFRRVLGVLQLIGAIVAVMIIAQTLIGYDTRLFFGEQHEYIQGGPGSFPRVRPPGYYLIYALFVPTVAQLAASTGRRWWLAAATLALYSVAVLISQQRTVWLALVLGIGAYSVLMMGRLQIRAVRGLVMASVAGACALAGTAYFVPGFTSTAMERLVIIGTEADVNTLDRLLEYRLAFDQIAEAPLFGSGPGIDYGAVAPNVQIDASQLVPRPYTHNSFVNLLLYFGVVGLGLFLAMLVNVLGRGWRSLQQDRDPARRNLASAVWCAVLVILISGVGTTSLDYAPMAAVLCLLLAALRALYQTPVTETRQEGEACNLTRRGGEPPAALCRA